MRVRSQEVLMSVPLFDLYVCLLTPCIKYVQVERRENQHISCQNIAKAQIFMHEQERVQRQ